MPQIFGWSFARGGDWHGMTSRRLKALQEADYEMAGMTRRLQALRGGLAVLRVLDVDTAIAAAGTGVKCPGQESLAS